MSSQAFEKQQARKYFGSLRRFLVNPDAQELAAKLASVLPQEARLCASYRGAKGELDPFPAVQQLSANIQWCYPRLCDLQAPDPAPAEKKVIAPSAAATPSGDSVPSGASITSEASTLAGASITSGASASTGSFDSAGASISAETSKKPAADMKFYLVTDSTEWSWHRLGFLEPPGQQKNEVCLHDCEAVLVPGVSFDLRGHRIGSGAGYYDRVLRGERCLKIGICYECQISHENLPTEEHDIAMDLVVTEKKIYRFTPKAANLHKTANLQKHKKRHGLRLRAKDKKNKAREEE